LKAPLLLSSLVLPLGDDARPETREVAATDGADEVGIEALPALQQSVEVGDVGPGTFEGLDQHLAGRARSSLGDALNDPLGAWVAAELVADRATTNQGGGRKTAER
jgi:hypothetical protein